MPIVERDVPGVDVWPLVDELADAVRAARTVVIHCRMGIGRASIIAALVLGRLGVDGALAFERLSAARGLRVPDTEEQRRWALARIASGR